VIHYGTSPAAMTESVSVSGSATTTYKLTGLTAGTWYFDLVAVAADGTESAPSAVESKTI
jgi:hypothetical protein